MTETGRDALDARNVLFVQRKAHKAGAQHCLARLLRQLAQRDLDPILLTSEDGWLTRECLNLPIPVIQAPFPSSRSVLGHLYKNASFTRRVLEELQRIGCRPPIVHGNDHPESLLTLELARALQTRSSLTLRTPGMTGRSYSKYRCGQVDLLIAVSDGLRGSVQQWQQGRDVAVIPDGLDDDEFLPPKTPLGIPQGRILVIGNGSARKGWQDLMAALEILWEQGELPGLHLDFTDQCPPWFDKFRLDNKCTLNFLGHRDDFRGLVREYDLVINPSRSESFGMAALEVIAAGIPLLSSRSGVIEDIIQDPRFLFQPRNPRSLASVLHDYLLHGTVTQQDLVSNQRRLRDRFHISDHTERLLKRYRRLLA